MASSNLRRVGVVTLGTIVWLAVTGASLAEGPALVQGGQPHSVIVVGPQADDFDRWVAGGLQRYLKSLSGAELTIVTSDRVPAGRPLVVLGGPQANPLCANAQQEKLVDFTGLKPEGFILKTVELNGRPALMVGGSDQTGTMYAVYELLERLGIVFQIDNDVIPRTKPDLALPTLDVRLEPAVKHRGFYCFHPMSSWAGLDDLKKQIDQAAKMKMNLFQCCERSSSRWSRSGTIPRKGTGSSDSTSRGSLVRSG